MSVYNLKIRGAKIEIIQHKKQYFQFPINKKTKKSYNLNKNVFYPYCKHSLYSYNTHKGIMLYF